MTDRIIVACFVWAVLLTIGNPFFENKNLRYITLGLAVVGTLLAVLFGFGQ